MYSKYININKITNYRGYSECYALKPPDIRNIISLY